MSAVESVTDASFEEEVLRAEGPVLVDFWAEWCGPCRQMHAILDRVAEERAGSLRVLKLDVDANPQTAARYRVIGIPAFKVFRDGVEIGSITGAKAKPAFEAELAGFID